jgi:hypothetical protein
MDYPNLSERRKADRIAMAKGIKEIAERYGATCEVEGAHDEIHIVAIHPGGLQLTFWLERKSCQPDVHVIPWHIHYESDARLSTAFGSVNPYHFRKATHVAHGWKSLATEIDRGFAAAADGSAYQQSWP